jgi:hypothetical protein
MLIHSNTYMSPRVLRLARKIYATRMAHDPVGTIMEEGNLSFVLQRPNVLFIIQPHTELHIMLKRSATDIKLNLNECVYCFHITDGEDSMFRYVADSSQDHVVARVSKYLQKFHRTWRITKVARVSGMRTLNSN